MFTFKPFRHIMYTIGRLGVTSHSFIVNDITLMAKIRKYYQVYRSMLVQ